ncbi:MAG: hybrid sensor histidine kinase/response regulator [Chloroflexi bacterium]|nr:hybrid sensor histidine kinase/response regulator [Chloroflexota bacterium]
MSASPVEQPVGPPEIGPMLRQLQEDTILLVAPGLLVASLALLGVARQFPDPAYAVGLSLLLCLIAALVWVLYKRCYLGAAWTLASGCTGSVFLLAVWGQASAGLAMLGLAVGLAAQFISVLGATLLATLCTALLVLAPKTILPADETLRAISLVMIWGTVGLVWLTSRPLATTLRWSWSSYEQSRSLLERARDQQVQLKQTLDDLAAANIQLVRLNQLANALRQAAEDARRTKEQFVSNVSHELRTPLNMIIGFAEMILEAPETYGSYIPAALLADLEVVRRNSQHLSSLIDDVLDLSQIEAGQMALVKERVTPRGIVDAAIAAVRALFESKRLYLRVEVPDDLPAVLCDRTRVREVVLNLLSNAGRFTEHGGVEVRAWREGEGLGSDVVVSVADTGPGIAPEDAERVFRPFQQLDASIRRRHGGTGLGLSISKSFVEQHGGRMWLESQPGAGTTFFFRLPVDPSVAVDGGASRWINPRWELQPRTRRWSLPPIVVRPRLVVLESGRSLQRLLARYMTDCELVPATNLAHAIQELAHAPTQALLVNGVSVGAALQELARSGGLPRSTPAIVCAVPGESEAASTLGVDDYLVKPVSRERLLAALDHLHLKDRTILVMDDEPEALQLFRRVLASAQPGYRVLGATNGREALDLLRTERPDAILLDLVMPDMDGFRLLEARNQDLALRHVPVVVISAHDPHGQLIVSNALGVVHSGGLAVHQLLACVEALIRILSSAGAGGDPVPTGEPAA